MRVRNMLIRAVHALLRPCTILCSAAGILTGGRTVALLRAPVLQIVDSAPRQGVGGSDQG